MTLRPVIIKYFVETMKEVEIEVPDDLPLDKIVASLRNYDNRTKWRDKCFYNMQFYGKTLYEDVDLSHGNAQVTEVPPDEL